MWKGRRPGGLGTGWEAGAGLGGAQSSGDTGHTGDREADAAAFGSGTLGPSLRRRSWRKSECEAGTARLGSRGPRAALWGWRQPWCEDDGDPEWLRRKVGENEP